MKDSIKKGEDLLANDVFVCMYCKMEFDVTQGTWPQNNYEHEPMMNADLNDRTREEFVCYECCD